MAEALIALGGNVGDVRTTFDRALAMLCDGATRASPPARPTTPRRPGASRTSRPSSIAAPRSTRDLTPHALLARAQEIERAFGRDRANERRWGPRTLDIDLIAYDDVTMNDATLTLPHPRLFERAFRAGAARRDRAGAYDRGGAGAGCVRRRLTRPVSRSCHRGSHARHAQPSFACRRVSAGDPRALAQAGRVAGRDVVGTDRADAVHDSAEVEGQALQL